MNPVFWTIATVLVVAVCATLIAPVLWRAPTADEAAAIKKRRLLIALAIAIIVPVASLATYRWVGSWSLTGVSASAQAAGAPPHAGAMGDGAAAGDMTQAIANLETRLSASPQDADGWELLSQSYAFQQRSAAAEAAQARADAVRAGTEVSPWNAEEFGGSQRSDQGLEALRARVRDNPNDADSWALLAEGYRQRRDFTNSLAAFERLVQLKAMNADLWADYADATAASSGGLNADSARMIDSALALDPNHMKGLWLKGSWQTRQDDYKAAAATWEKMLAMLPADASDARIIRANLDEARAKMTGAPTAAAPAAARSAGISGEIEIDARWRAKAAPGAVLYVFAKAEGQPGPPLAVLRTAVKSWPVTFRLDDSQAMMPTRRLSQFQRVVVEARISQSGSADPAPGDLRGRSKVIDQSAASAPVRVLINEEVG
ncbi:MAG: hypothetical protein R3E77_14620 [Steroidobacteraceae bacterium]